MDKNLIEDQTKFCDILGYSPESKILELLLEGREEEYTFNDIIKALGVNRKRGYQILKHYHKKGIIRESKKVKHIRFYELNKNEERVKLLVRLFDKLIAG